jgi:hypothetical protein
MPILNDGRFMNNGLIYLRTGDMQLMFNHAVCLDFVSLRVS